MVQITDFVEFGMPGIIRTPPFDNLHHRLRFDKVFTVKTLGSSLLWFGSFGLRAVRFRGPAGHINLGVLLVGSWDFNFWGFYMTTIRRLKV